MSIKYSNERLRDLHGCTYIDDNDVIITANTK